MAQDVIATMVTTTSYGTWLPGDLRGYVKDKQILPHDPALLKCSRELMIKEPVFFNAKDRADLFEALVAAGREFRYAITDISIDAWHLHWVVCHGYDPVRKMVGRLKTRMRQKLDRGRIWTDGYCHRCLFSDEEIESARRYIARHAGCRLVAGRVPAEPREPPAEPGADGV